MDDANSVTDFALADVVASSVADVLNRRLPSRYGFVVLIFDTAGGRGAAYSSHVDLVDSILDDYRRTRRPE